MLVQVIVFAAFDPFFNYCGIFLLLKKRFARFPVRNSNLFQPVQPPDASKT
jgi:hypothetical protein